MKRDKKLIKIAQDIITLEQDMALGKNIESCKSKIQQIANSLSITEMLMIDSYIMEQQMLKEKKLTF